jgi:putative Ca2+/H+ antiporter (TMEM165/GDT1 family)
VLAGVGAAFAVQCLLAVTAGRLLGLLPQRAVLLVAALLFAVGSFVLLREDGEDEVEDAGPPGGAPAGGWRAAGTSFGVLFAAEWGDASQLLTAGLTARYDDPVAVFFGAWGALLSVAVLAVVGGRFLLRAVPLVLVRRVAAALFGVLALVCLVEAVRS